MSPLGGWLVGWRPALRLARRDALRARGRSLLVLVMIALPVLAVTAAAVVQATADVSGVEGADRRMGAAEARIRPAGGTIFQAPDPDQLGWGNDGDGGGERPSYDAVTDVLGDVRAITLREGWTEVPLGDRRVGVSAREVDLRDPLAAGLFDITAGRAAATPDEAVVNDVLVARGIGLGDTVTVGDRDFEVVGTGRHATQRDTATVDVLPDALGPGFAAYAPDVDWLVDGDPVLWSDVLALNRAGLVVTSRAVLADPPPVQEMAEQMGYDSGYGDALAIVALIVTMALLEVVLLAGPAFAVSARRQARSLALMAATGGTPRQARRVVLASGIVLGALAALAGAVLGVVVGWALLPLAQRWSGEWFGPVDVDWRVVAVVAAFGLLSAVLAAVVPAVIASRQDVVAVLAGRRGDRPPSARTPVLGVVLLGAGVALSAYGVTRRRRRALVHRGRGDRVGARDDPGRAGRGRGGRPALAAAAAGPAVRRPRRRPAPHPHRPGGRRGGRDRGRGGDPGDRGELGRGAEPGDVLPVAADGGRDRQRLPERPDERPGRPCPAGDVGRRRDRRAGADRRGGGGARRPAAGRRRLVPRRRLPGARRPAAAARVLGRSPRRQPRRRRHRPGPRRAGRRRPRRGDAGAGRRVGRGLHPASRGRRHRAGAARHLRRDGRRSERGAPPRRGPRRTSTSAPGPRSPRPWCHPCWPRSWTGR